MSLLSEEIPSYEALIHEEEFSPLNLKLIIDGVSSIPLYDRLGIKKESLCENETILMELQAKEYSIVISNFIENKKIESHNDGFSKSESEYSKTEEFSDLFLKYLYNCSNNDELLTRLKRNTTIEEGILESTDEVKVANETEFTPSKEFLQFFLNASDGKYDNFVVHEPLPSHDLYSDDSSDDSSDDKVEIMADKIKELSYQLKFCNSSTSKFLEPIINANKFNAFEMVSDSSFEKPTLKKGEIFLSDSESENYLRINHSVFEVDKPSNKQSSFQKNNDIKVLRKKREKYDCKKSGNRNSDSISKEKKAKENLQNPRSHSNIPIIDQAKINVDNLITSTTSTNVLVSPKQKNNITENTKKHTSKKTDNNETSSSGDENWEDLAEKNLKSIQSKTLGQKDALKK